MFAIIGVGREVFVVEVTDPLLNFEAEVLIEHHGRVVHRDVQSDVLAGASLEKKVVEDFFERKPFLLKDRCTFLNAFVHF